MLDPFFIVLPHAPSEMPLMDHLADVLEDKLLRSQVGFGAQAISFLFRFYDGHIGVFLSLKPLVLTFSATAAISYTFDLGCAVDTIRILATSQIFGIYRV